MTAGGRPHGAPTSPITLIDYLMVQDPEGKSLPPRTTVAMKHPVKEECRGRGRWDGDRWLHPEAGHLDHTSFSRRPRSA